MSEHQTWLTRSIDNPPSRLGIDLVPGCRLCSCSAADRPPPARSAALVAVDPLAVDRVALGCQPRRHAARAVIRPSQILPIDQRHDRAVIVIDRGRLPVDRCARYCQQPTLLQYRQRRVFAARPARGVPLRLICRAFCAKKSFSTFSWPICRYRTSTCASLAVPSATLPPSKNAGGAIQQLLLPAIDLVRMNPEMTRQLGHRPVAFHRRQRYLRLERRVCASSVFASCPAPALSALSRGRASTLANCLIFGVQLSPPDPQIPQWLSPS